MGMWRAKVFNDITSESSSDESEDLPAKYAPIAAGDYVASKFTSQTTFEAWDESDREKFDTQDTELRFSDDQG